MILNKPKRLQQTTRPELEPFKGQIVVVSGMLRKQHKNTPDGYLVLVEDVTVARAFVRQRGLNTLSAIRTIQTDHLWIPVPALPTKYDYYSSRWGVIDTYTRNDGSQALGLRDTQGEAEMIETELRRAVLEIFFLVSDGRKPPKDRTQKVYDQLKGLLERIIDDCEDDKMTVLALRRQHPRLVGFIIETLGMMEVLLNQPKKKTKRPKNKKGFGK